MFELNPQIVVGDGQNSKPFTIDLFLGIPLPPLPCTWRAALSEISLAAKSLRAWNAGGHPHVDPTD